MLGGIGGFIGALVVTFFLSRVLLQVVPRATGGIFRLAIAHGLSFTICIMTTTLTMSGWAFPEITTLTGFLPPQGIWFVFDVLRRYLRMRRSHRPSA